jgi:short-subunit dehydrogenase
MSTGKRSILITGASRGIGRALCEAALTRGYEVHGLVRKADQCPVGVHAHVGDLRDRPAIRALMRNLAPRIDWYVANAGVSADLHPGSEDAAERAAEIMDINGTATIHSMYALAHEWIRLGLRGKRIGVVASLAAEVALPKSSIYSASKAAQLIACQGLEYDLDRHGISVSAILPGFIETDMTATLPHKPFVMSPQEAAERIFRGLERGDRRIAFPQATTWLVWLYRLTPGFLLRTTVQQLERHNKL